MMMLFWKNFTVFHWLHGGMVMILVHLAVDGGLGLFMADLRDVFLHDSGSYLLVDCGVMVTSLGPRRIMASVKAKPIEQQKLVSKWQRKYAIVDKLRMQILQKSIK